MVVLAALTLLCRVLGGVAERLAPDCEARLHNLRLSTARAQLSAQYVACFGSRAHPHICHAALEERLRPRARRGRGQQPAESPAARSSGASAGRPVGSQQRCHDASAGS